MNSKTDKAAEERERVIKIIARALVEVEHNGPPIQDTNAQRLYWATVRASYIFAALGK